MKSRDTSGSNNKFQKSTKIWLLITIFLILLNIYSILTGDFEPRKSLVSIIFSSVIIFVFTGFIYAIIGEIFDLEKKFQNKNINISSNHIIIILLLIIIAGGGYFLSQDRQSNTEIRYIPKIINQYVPSFNFPPFTGGSLGTKYKAPGDNMIENGLKLLSPEKNKSKPILTKVCVKKTVGGQVSKTVALSAMCPFGYKEIGK